MRDVWKCVKAALPFTELQSMLIHLIIQNNTNKDKSSGDTITKSTKLISFFQVSAEADYRIPLIFGR